MSFDGNVGGIKLLIRIVIASYLNNTYWFIPAYILYFLFISALRIVVNIATKEELKKLCITLCGACFFEMSYERDCYGFCAPAFGNCLL